MACLGKVRHRTGRSQGSQPGPAGPARSGDTTHRAKPLGCVPRNSLRWTRRARNHSGYVLLKTIMFHQKLALKTKTISRTRTPASSATVPPRRGFQAVPACVHRPRLRCQPAQQKATEKTHTQAWEGLGAPRLGRGGQSGLRGHTSRAAVSCAAVAGLCAQMAAGKGVEAELGPGHSRQPGCADPRAAWPVGTHTAATLGPSQLTSGTC